MNILLFSLFLIVSAFLIHLIVWRIRVPRYQTRTIFAIFLGVFFLSVPVFELFLPGEFRNIFRTPQNFWEYAHVFLFFISFTLAYMITYSALEVDSPSLMIIHSISSAGPAGLRREALNQHFADDRLLLPRVYDLLRDNMLILRGDRLFLTPKGKHFVKIFIAYRSWLGAEKGG